MVAQVPSHPRGRRLVSPIPLETEGLGVSDQLDPTPFTFSAPHPQTPVLGASTTPHPYGSSWTSGTCVTETTRPRGTPPDYRLPSHTKLTVVCFDLSHPVLTFPTHTSYTETSVYLAEVRVKMVSRRQWSRSSSRRDSEVKKRDSSLIFMEGVFQNHSWALVTYISSERWRQ